MLSILLTAPTSGIWEKIPASKFPPKKNTKEMNKKEKKT